MTATASHHEVGQLDELWRCRPRSRLLRGSIAALAGFAIYAWLCGEIEWRSFLTARRMDNLQRFLNFEIVPFPLREQGFEPGAFWDWMAALFFEHGFEAVLATLGIAVLSIVLAATIAGVLAPLAASNLATDRPFHADDKGSRPWLVLRLASRTTMIVLRAIPEYVLAFLFLAILGPDTAWPAIAALALHNGGILGRLEAETIENLDPRPLRALHAIGASRTEIFIAGVFPQAMGRYLLYFFYRFETCVREASVLGILGIVSLGYWIEEARAKHYYDEMFFFVALGALIVIAADFLSAGARRYIRRG